MGIQRTLFSGPRLYGGRGKLEQLPSNLTINGTTKSPVFLYLGQNATGNNWNPQSGYGNTITLQAGSPSLSQPAAPNLSSKDKSVLFDGTAYYQCATNSLGDITTEDIVCELVFKQAAGLKRFAWKKNGIDEGWIASTNTGPIFFHIEQASGAHALVQSASLSTDTWYHAMFFINRDENSTNGGKVYVNGSLSGSANLSAVQASLTNNDFFTIGAKSDGFQAYDKNIAYFALWIEGSWHQAGAAGPAEWATIASNRATFLGF